MQAAYSSEKLVTLLESTLNPTLRKQAEDELGVVRFRLIFEQICAVIYFSIIKIHNTAGFSFNLLQLVMTDQVQMPVRQAGAIYLKNMINQYWIERKLDKPNELVPFFLPESDKSLIRDNLIEALIHSPDPIRYLFIKIFPF